MKKIYLFFKSIWINPSNKGERLKRLFFAFVWQIYKRTYGKPIITNLDNGPSFVIDAKSGNSVGVIYSKIYEAEYIYFLRKHIRDTDGKKTLLDIGAHTGLFSLLIHHKFSKIVGFEPAQDTFELIQRNIALNPNIDFIVEQLGVSNVNKNLEFVVTGVNSGMNKIAKNAEDFGIATHTIKCTTVDDYVLRYPEIKGVSCIKIDTEGHELEALQGAIKTIKQNPDIIIIFENSSFDEIQELFKTQNLKSFAINKHGDILQGIEMKSAYNLFAVGPMHSLYKNLL